MAYYRSAISAVSLSYSQLQDLVPSKAYISWTGCYKEPEVLIRLVGSESHCMCKLDVTTLPVPPNPQIVDHNESTTKTRSFVEVIWQRWGWFKTMRHASIYGINVASRGLPGLGNTPTNMGDDCVMGYDIETSLSLTKAGSFPSARSPITSIAIWCSCGMVRTWTTLHASCYVDATYATSSSLLVRLSLDAIAAHMPTWLVGYNCYQFDNCVMAYHSPKDIASSFRNINSGSKSMSKFSFYIDLPGVNNVDLYAYLDKCLRSNYKALNLDSVAEHHGLPGKLQMPHDDAPEHVAQLLEYNVNDSMITSKLWRITGCEAQVLGLCSASCAPLVDCVRYITGTMSSCAASSYCISNGSLIDWSECNLRIGYEGGTVLEPDRKIHRNVVVCDFSSMYPTIIMDIGVSPENIEVLGSCSGSHEDKLLHWTKSSTMACIRGKILKYSRYKKCMTRDVLQFVISTRKKHKESNPAYSTALKVLANSLYGALGYAASPLHSPRCAATVTVCGRTVLALAEVVFRNVGLSVVYGDTDSCFLARGEKTATHFNNSVTEHTDSGLRILHTILRHTPMSSMRMEKEDTFRAMLPVDKKHYAYVTSVGQVKTKGLSERRKDRFGLCRDMTSLIASHLLVDESCSREKMAMLIDGCFSMARHGFLDLYSISKEVRHEGNTCYRYTDIHGEIQNVPVSKAHKSDRVSYDCTKLLDTLEKDLNRLCVPAGVGSVKNLLLDVPF